MTSLYQTVEIQINKLEPERGYPVRLTVDQHRHFSGGYLPPDIADNWIPSAKPQDDGAWLFEQLFTAEQQSQWATIRGMQPRRQIRLRIDAATPELHALPWELLRDVTPGLQSQQRLSVQAETPFSRYWESQFGPVSPLLERPVRLLLVIANPVRLDRYDLPQVEVAAERQLLENTLAELINQKHVELTVLAGEITLEELGGALRAEQPYHMLHIVAHGLYSRQRQQQAALLLADSFDGQARPVTDTQISDMLSRLEEQPRFIFLSSCHTAHSDPTNARQGMAPRVLEAGIPVVLAMQDTVSIATARRFSPVFYQQLFKHGLVDLATNQARAALVEANKHGEHVPVLFSRLPENQLLVTTRDALGNPVNRTEFRRQSFSERYRQAVADHLDRVQLFGLDDQYLGKYAAQRRYPLSVAYIPLRLESNQHAERQWFDHEADLWQPEISQSNPTEQALYANRSGRLFIQGDAGSGKTTLLSWIAVQVAQQKLPDFLHEWNEAVPFFLRLRSCYEKLPLPLDRYLELVEWRAIPSESEQPDPDWVQHLLRAGRGLILVDGFDEVPTAQHDRVIDWLADMVREYPDNRYLLTSRPLHRASTDQNTVDNPVQDLGFEFARLPPMDDEEITALIEHWHAAVKVRLQSRTDSQAQRLLTQLPQLEQDLINQIMAEPRLKELAKTPLLSAMLCARHRNKEGQLPTNRIQLYEESIRMLLGNRDRERGLDRPDVDHPDYPYLKEAEKWGCLQEVAYWMMDEGQSEIVRPLLEEQLARRLRQYHHVPRTLTAPQMLDFYVERSSLLRPVGVARYIFAHRTFQEYLAAMEIKGLRKMNSLLRRSSDSEWHETISLFVNLVEPHDANQALQRLISMVAEAAPKRQRQQYRLVLACLREHVQPLDEPTQAALGTAIQGLLPPQTETDATHLVYAQQFALPYLAYQDGYSEEEVAYCVQILGQIGGQEAFDLLKGYAPDQRIGTQKALLRAWSNFDQNKFAQKILTVNFNGQLGLDYNGKMTSLEWVQYLPWLQSLYLSFTQINDLSPLARLSKLQTLQLWDTQVRNLSPLTKLPNLQSLILAYTQVRDLSPLTKLSYLQSLNLSGAPVSDFSPLTKLSYLQSLNLSFTKVRDLSPLAQLDKLQYLDLSGTPVSDLSPLTQLDKLQTLDLSFTQVSNLSPLVTLPKLQYLYLSSTPMNNLSPLAQLTKLQYLDLAKCKQLKALRPLQELPALRHVDLRHIPNAEMLLAEMPTSWLERAEVKWW